MTVIILGIVLLIIGLLVAKLSVLFVIGIVLILAGLLLEIVGAGGRTIGGRRHWY